MGGSLRLGRLFGIPFAINYTWFIIFFIVTISLAQYYFPSRYSWTEPTYWVVGIVTSLLFFASVVIHELSHSFVAWRNGIPVKSITLFIFGGVAQITREATTPGVELIMAAAGPAASLILALFFWVIAFLFGGLSQPLGAVAQWLALINVSLGIFNLAPGFPLDGGRVLRSILWGATGDYRRATRIASIVGQAMAYLLILTGVFIIFTGDWINGLWLAFIGWFLENAAQASYRQVVLRDTLRGHTASELMTQDCSMVSPDMSVGELVRDYIMTKPQRCFLVTVGSDLSGIMTLHNVKQVPQERWDTTPLSQAMTPMEKLKIASPSDDAMSILERMDEEDINQMPVVDDGQVVGMIGRDNLLRFIRIRSELGMGP